MSPSTAALIAQTACIAGTSRDSYLNSCSLTAPANAQSTSTNSLQPAAQTNYLYPIHSTDSKCHSLTHSISLRQPTTQLSPLTIQFTKQIYDPSHYTNAGATHSIK